MLMVEGCFLVQADDENRCSVGRFYYENNESDNDYDADHNNNDNNEIIILIICLSVY